MLGRLGRLNGKSCSNCCWCSKPHGYAQPMGSPVCRHRCRSAHRVKKRRMDRSEPPLWPGWEPLLGLARRRIWLGAVASGGAMVGKILIVRPKNEQLIKASIKNGMIRIGLIRFGCIITSSDKHLSNFTASGNDMAASFVYREPKRIQKTFGYASIYGLKSHNLVAINFGV